MSDDRKSRSAGPTVALPETRQLDVLARLLERRGFAVLRCPLVSILDAPDPAVVTAWIERLIASPPDCLVLFTGEGFDRLVAVARDGGLERAFLDALARTPILTRGPKPVRALRVYGLKPAWEATRPTTNGVIEALENLAIDGWRVGVQLYGGEPNPALEAYLERRRVQVDFVAPYVYASGADDAAVLALIDSLESGSVDAIAFTSKSQVTRLFAVARAARRDEALRVALGQRLVAAIGPVVARALEAEGIAVDVMPESDYFMKPLVTRLVGALTPP